ncbi:hypothetical protein WR25_09026 [Diploscapter pachys]|uniref:Uncharacterized protein n=1 Tax=Diploscapter pachys TaxID=2018661 RepID=A0A2A2M1F9_9BILA|nr:hypothetical protein WR25_09026 [Diploscapter pachys]
MSRRSSGRVPLKSQLNLIFEEESESSPKMLNDVSHPRDGALLRKKQEQWAREREEEAQMNYWPFGSPGGGAPNQRRKTMSPSIREKDKDNQQNEVRSIFV